MKNSSQLSETIARCFRWKHGRVVLLLFFLTALLACPQLIGSKNFVVAQETGDFSKFPHSNPMHARLPCLLCHRREGTANVPTLPGGKGHVPCAGCHAQQFANNSSPVCTICHTDVKSGALKPFPRMYNFRMTFDHSKHMAMGRVNCSTCHRPAQAGVALTIPSGFNAHAVCYRCHGPESQSNGKDISTCGTCHQLGSYSRTPMTAASFKLGFSHAKHDNDNRLNCNDCHSVKAGLPQRRQVTAPQPANHHASGRALSCQSCHNGTRAFGGDDFTACKRCHTGNAWRF
jgi:predicted CXXCH cytochrome family protein